MALQRIASVVCMAQVSPPNGRCSRIPFSVGVMVGDGVGACDGDVEGLLDGSEVGFCVGDPVGTREGSDVLGTAEGKGDG